jgi:glycerol uptake facilitator-like aquaporin
VSIGLYVGGRFEAKEFGLKDFFEIASSIPVTNTSLNPARRTGVALYVGGWAISQLWLFWVAPIIGVVLGGIVYRFLGSKGE